MKVEGVVEPPVKTNVLVTLARKKGARFKQVAKKRVRSDASGRYSAALPRARRGKCRVIARFRSAAGPKQTKNVRNLGC